jgi:hypothetical protein
MPNNDIAWRYIADQINRKKCTPVISNQLILGALFPGQAVANEWAKSGGYPLADANLALVAQYLSVTYRDAYRAKTEYLEFLKQRYLAATAQDATLDQTLLDQVRRERGLSFSQLVGDRLGYPAAGDTENPLNLLAAFDMPVYLTTSPHLLLETALRNLKQAAAHRGLHLASQPGGDHFRRLSPQPGFSADDRCAAGLSLTRAGRVSRFAGAE